MNSKINLPSATCPGFGYSPIANGGYYCKGCYIGFRWNDPQPSGTVLVFYCHTPYVIESGAPRATCTDAGTWSRKPPTCVKGKALLFQN